MSFGDAVESLVGFLIAAFLIVWILLFFVAMIRACFIRDTESQIPPPPPPKERSSPGRESEEDSF